MRTALDNSAQTVYNYDSTDLRSVTVTAVTADGVTTTYTYDANGNTLTAGDKTYTYNDRGQQTGYSNGTTAAAYAYNPSGLRKAKTVGGSTKYFVYNGMNIVYEYSESVADGIAYFYGLNRMHNSEGEIYVYNAHGDVVQLVKDNSVVASYTYDAFGNLTSQIGESDNPFLYCGEYFDAETQTYYLRARYYNPANGRFTQQDAWSFMDTSDPLSLNLYTYCCNNPVLYVDPSGTTAKDITAGIILALDDYVTGGFAKWLVEKYQKKYLDYQYEDEADYYLGRTFGVAIAEAIGAASTVLGIIELFGSIAAGGGITILSDGTAVGFGVSIAVEGVAVGVAEVGVGVAVLCNAGSNFKNELSNYQDAVSRSQNPSKNESKVWSSLDNVRGKSRKTSGHGKNKRYYEWDYTHNDIEVYDKDGFHLGSMDPVTGEMYKPAVKGRKIKV